MSEKLFQKIDVKYYENILEPPPPPPRNFNESEKNLVKMQKSDSI